MSRHGEEERILALAGIFQAATLVDRLARRGVADEGCMAVCLGSILATDPEAVDSVYDGGAEGLRTGLESICRHFGPPSKDGGGRDFDVVRYVLSSMQIAHKLVRRPDLLRIIAEGIDRVRPQVERFSLCHDNVLANLADVYTRSISEIRPRIVVKGHATHLTNPRQVDRVRALLFAAVRSAVLWRQCGGRRLEFFYRRSAMVRCAARLLETR